MRDHVARRPGSSHFRRLLVAVAAAAALAGSAAAAAATGSTAGQAAGSPPRPAATTPVTHRPAHCPPVPAEQGGADDEKKTATGTFPWPATPHGVDPSDFAAYAHTPKQKPPLRPANWKAHDSNWKLTSARSTDPTVAGNPQELCGVKGSSVDLAWQTTTGAPSTLIAVTDSGIEWCDPSIVDKIYVNRKSVPLPENAAGKTKPQLEQAGEHVATKDPYDLNGDGVFNAADFAHDPRIKKPYFCQSKAGKSQAGKSGGAFVSSEDLIRAFGQDGREGPPGFTEAISGWNFVDDNNDPYDDVHYDHGTHEAKDSTGAANTLNHRVGTCPNCLVLPIRVGDSFIASADAFASGVLFAVDSGASVVQEALGTLDVNDAARQAVEYAVKHGVPVVASAADEEAEHHNLPAVLQHTIVVNSTTKYFDEGGIPLFAPQSYLYLNGCTNYGANIAVTVESASCSSEATGKSGGIVGLAETVARQAMAAGKLKPYPGLTTVAGKPVALSADEIKQLVTTSADDVDFQKAALPLGPPNNYGVLSPIPTTRYPTQPGFDIYTGFGRMNAATIVRRIADGDIPPEARFDLGWFGIDRPDGTLTVHGLVGAVRSPSYSWILQAAPGAAPEPGAWQTLTSGHGTGDQHGVLAHLDLSKVAAMFPSGTTFTGGPVGAGGRPKADKFSYSLRLVVSDAQGRIGVDRRTRFLHRDDSLLPGFPRHFGGSVDAPPTLAPIGPHGDNAMIVATADGVIHALDPDGNELPGWPQRTHPVGYHPGEPAYASGAVTAVPRATMIGGVAVGDLEHPGGDDLDVVASSYDGRVFAWNAQGKLLPGFPVRTDPAYSGPKVRDPHNRVLRGIVGAPALADLEGNGKLDIVASSMDRHVYAWRPDGTPVPGWPVLVVDPAKVAKVNPATHKVTLKPNAKADDGTKLIDTPAIGALSGHGRPDVVVGSNEEYEETPNVSVLNLVSFVIGKVPLLSPVNSRVYAIAPTGSKTKARSGASGGPPGFPNEAAFLPGWPASIADIDSELLPDVGDGTPGSPALADLAGNGELQVGVFSAAGPGYLLNPDGRSYLGTGAGGRAHVLSSVATGVLTNTLAGVPSFPALGMGVFAPLRRDSSGISFVAPAISIAKALDEALPARQQPNDNEIDAWNTRSSLFRLGFPSVTNDLQFLAEPIVASVAGAGHDPYVVEGSGTYDVRAVNVRGQSAPGFPKFTGGWVVNSPSVGAFGALDHQVVAVGTREGNLFVWRTPLRRCDPSGPWPREHHDLSNTGNLTATGAAAFSCTKTSASSPGSGHGAGGTSPGKHGDTSPGKHGGRAARGGHGDSEPPGARTPSAGHGNGGPAGSGAGHGRSTEARGALAFTGSTPLLPIAGAVLLGAAGCAARLRAARARPPRR
jgi:hypothetical protein